ncbi:ROK family protein [Frankia sp. CNm7]|uniref:ROK family protein n=1 Tax=Frankia nepalensis TaxID=1836974 RepID=A0A937RHX5_9ACTN|nr:ROK family protein [Frankia nepalensis]MBL7500319.1 ROK family protein [Frankia nepalensis]MBL7508541.1 ROK family protein [Frankia nepalensis]MBL7520418.1 ROK family protein [Frankia nepalensis]MBL7627669.1 ROK family protein [Frankia nepalensis]
MRLHRPHLSPAGIKQEELRRHNLSLLLRYVHLAGPTQRATLTARTGLNRSTIGALAADLANIAELVREEAPGVRSGAGRPSLVVVPETEHYQALAFDLGVDRIVGARVGLGGTMLSRKVVPLPPGDRNFESVVALTVTAARQLADEFGPRARCVGVGVAVPAVVRGTDGFVRFAPNLGWEQQPLGETLGAALVEALPGCSFDRAAVLVANDADLGALAEHTRGVARGHDDVVYLSGNVGVGAGVICGGRPLRGHGGYAGEAGHMIVNPAGQRCRCGARGCWETEVGIDAVLRAAGHEPGDGTTPRMVVADAQAGDQRARHALYEISRWLAVGVGNLVNLFNPELVIFGGELRELLEAVECDVVNMMGAGGLTMSREHVELVPSALGGDSPLFGAAELAFAPLLDDPLGVAATLPATGG